jgi:hypothetical protein
METDPQHLTISQYGAENHDEVYSYLFPILPQARADCNTISSGHPGGLACHGMRDDGRGRVAGPVQTRQHQASHTLVWALAAVIRLSESVLGPLASGDRGTDHRVLEPTQPCAVRQLLAGQAKQTGRGRAR